MTITFGRSFGILSTKGFGYEYKWEFEKFWGKNAKPETITLSQSDFDALTERLNEKPDPKALESIRKLLDRRAPWDT
jgi:hypothetical protein